MSSHRDPSSNRTARSENERPTPRQESPAALRKAPDSEDQPVSTILPPPLRGVSLVVALEAFADQVALCRARVSEALRDPVAFELEAGLVADRLAVVEIQLRDVVNAVPEGTYTYP